MTTLIPWPHGVLPDWRFEGRATQDKQQAYRRQNITLGLPRLGRGWSVTKRLAIVGGAPSLLDHIKELRSFNGDIWGINGAWCELARHGISAALYSIDCDDEIMPAIADGAPRAVLAETVHPDTIAAVAGPVELFGCRSGATSACVLPLVTVGRGHREVHLYGCDGSYGARTHAYNNVVVKHRVAVECAGAEYITTAPMLVQCEILAAACREHPDVFKNRSGGLLEAMVASPQYVLTAVTPDIHPSALTVGGSVQFSPQLCAV